MAKLQQTLAHLALKNNGIVARFAQGRVR